MDLKKYPNVTIIEHPLLKHKITMLRDVNTQTNEFRRLVKEVAILEGYEALKNLPTHNIDVQTPLEVSSEPVVDSKKLCFVPILRAGLGMVDGMVELVPNAKVGHVGLYRERQTKKPVEYYVKLPNSIKECEVYVLDPMLATGGSAIDAVRTLKNRGAAKVSFICIIAVPEGVQAFCEVHPDVPLYIGALDRQLDENAYIRPGLGDCGDRVFGTTVKD